MTLTRRTVVGMAAVAAAGLVQGASKVKEGRIDTHHHFMPDAFVKAIGADRLASVTPTKTLPDWSVQRALDVCGSNGVSEAILSISPGYPAIDAKVERPLMRTCNEIAATLRRDHPGRFGHFASVPMFDVPEALKEIDHAFTALKSDGVVVFTNYSGRYLGDPSFDEIWAELNLRKAVVFIHPTSPGYELRGQPPQSIIEFPFETVRAATSLLFAGVTRRYPDIRFVLSHGGGALPFLAGRISGAASLNPQSRDRVPDMMAEIRRFWFDTALTGNPSALAALFAVADPSRVLFGSDFPYAPDGIIRANVAGQDEFPLDERVRAKLGRGNAAALLGRSA